MSAPQTPREQVVVSGIAESTTAAVAGVALTPSRGSTPGTNKSNGMLSSPTMRVGALGVPPLFRHHSPAAAKATAVAVPERSASAPPPKLQGGARVSFDPADADGPSGGKASSSSKVRRPGSSARTPSPSVRVSSGLAKDIKKLMKGSASPSSVTSSSQQPRPPRRASPTPPRPPLDKPDPTPTPEPDCVVVAPPPAEAPCAEREPSPSPRSKTELPQPTAPSHSPDDTARMPGSLSPLSPLSQTRERAVNGEAVTSTAFRIVSHGLTQCREICPSALGPEFASAIVATSAAGDSTNASVARATPLISPAFDSPARPGHRSATVSPAPSPPRSSPHGKVYHGTHARDCADHYAHNHHHAPAKAEPEVEVFGGELREAVVDLREAFTDFEAVCSTHDELGAIVALHGLQAFDEGETFDSRVRVLTWSKRVRELESRAAKAATSVDKALRHRRTGGGNNNSNHHNASSTVGELREMDLSVDEVRVADLYEHALQQVLEETGALLRLHERYRRRVEELESVVVHAEERRSARSRSDGGNCHRRTASSDAQVQTVQPASPPAQKAKTVARPETSTQSNQTSPLQKKEPAAESPRRVVQGVPITPPESPVRGVVVNAIPLPAAVTDASAAERDSRHQALLRNESRRNSSSTTLRHAAGRSLTTDGQDRGENVVGGAKAVPAAAAAASAGNDNYSPRQRRLAELAARQRDGPVGPAVTHRRVVVHHATAGGGGGGLHLWEAPERAPAVPKLQLGSGGAGENGDRVRRTAAAAAILGGHQQQERPKHVWESATSYEPVGHNFSNGSVQAPVDPPASGNVQTEPERVAAASAASPSGKRYSLLGNQAAKKCDPPLEPGDPSRCAGDCPEYLDHYHAALHEVSQQQVSSASARQHDSRGEPVTSRVAHPAADLDDALSRYHQHHYYALSPPPTARPRPAAAVPAQRHDPRPRPYDDKSPSPARRPTEPEPFDFLTERRSCNRCVRHLRVQLTGGGDKENRAATTTAAAAKATGRGWDSSPNPHSHHRVVPRVTSPSAKERQRASPTKPVAMHQRRVAAVQQLRGRSSAVVASRLDFRTAEEVAAQQSHIEATRSSPRRVVSPRGPQHRQRSASDQRRVVAGGVGRAHVVPVPVRPSSRHGGRRHVEAPFQAREGRQHIDPTRWVSTGGL